MAIISGKAITIHFPWAWAIVHGYKRVENRTWETSYRGPLLIHSGQSPASDERATQILRTLSVAVPPQSQFVRGRILGVVDLVDILPLKEYLAKHGDSPLNRGLAVGPYCWVLANPRICEPIPCSGNFQLWSAARAIRRYGGNPNGLLAEKRFR